MLRAGSLNRRVTIQRPNEGQDEFGQADTGWTDVATVWANILMRSGKETMSGSRDVSQVVASIRIRFRADITSAMRVVHKNTIYNVLAALPDAAGREYVDLMVSTGENDG